MKKTFVLFAAFVACIALSCSKINEEIVDPETGMKTVTITATIDEPETRTSYTGSTFSWTTGDQISVLGSDNIFYTFTATSTAASTTFTGELPVGVNLDDSFALFPADAGHTTTKFSVPKTKDTRATGSADLPMYGKKGAGNVYSFTHMTGGIRLTIGNFPASITYATISVVNASLKLSGLFTINESGEYHVWSAAGGSSVDEKSFIRTVPVVDCKADVFIPYAAGGDMWANSTLNVTGYNSSDVPTVFVTDKNIKGNGTAHVRAQIIPYQPLMLYNAPDFSLPGVVTTSCGANHTQVAEMKSYADKGYIHLQFHGTTAAWTGNSMTLYIYDGGTDNDAPYTAWNQKKVTNELHTSTSISTSALSVSLGGKSCTTSVTDSDGQTYWTISIPRTASSAMMGSTGSVYVGFFIQDSGNSWATTAAIPEVYDSQDMVTVTLP